MSAQTTMAHVRVDEALKERAATALAAMGLSTADAIRMASPTAELVTALEDGER